MRWGPILFAAAALALSACQKSSEPPVGAAVEPPAAGKGVPTPVPPSGEFDSISRTATSVTGDLSAEDGTLRFDQGQRYTIAGEALTKGSDRFAASGATWSALVNIPADAVVGVFRIVAEDRGLARNGGFCGQDSATYVAMHQGLDLGGAPALFIVAFKGEHPPGPAQPEANLCGAFLYAPKPGRPTTEK